MTNALQKPTGIFSTWITKPGGHTHEFYDQEVIEDGTIHLDASADGTVAFLPASPDSRASILMVDRAGQAVASATSGRSRSGRSRRAWR